MKFSLPLVAYSEGATWNLDISLILAVTVVLHSVCRPFYTFATEVAYD